MKKLGFAKFGSTSGASGGQDPDKPSGGKKVEQFFGSLNPLKSKKSNPPRQTLAQITASLASGTSTSAADAVAADLAALGIEATEGVDSPDKARRTPLQRMMGKKREKTPEERYEARFEELDDESAALVRSLKEPGAPRADFVKAAQQMDVICAMKPAAAALFGDKFEALKWGGLFQHAAKAGQYDLLTQWMRKFDNVETQCTLLGDIGFGLKHRPSDAPARAFIDKVCAYYLHELPARVQQSDGKPPSPFSHEQLDQILASFADKLAYGSGDAHAPQFFDNMPMNLFHMFDEMTPKWAMDMFGKLRRLCESARKVADASTVHWGSSRPAPPPLTDAEQRRAEMVWTCSRFAQVMSTDNGVQLDAKIGQWAMQGRKYEQAAYRITTQTPDSSVLAECRDAQSMKRWKMDISGMALDNLPKKFETLNYFQRMNLSNNNIERIPMEMADMEYFSGYTRRSPQDGRIEIDLTGNPLTKMTLAELKKLDDPVSRPFGPIFKLPERIALESGELFESAEAKAKAEAQAKAEAEAKRKAAGQKQAGDRKLTSLTPEQCRLLGVDKRATSKEIEIAWRKRSLESHPDKFTDPAQKERADARMKDINAAHDVVKAIREADAKRAARSNAGQS